MASGKSVDELEAIKTALQALEPLDDEGRRRALDYLQDRLDIALSAKKAFEEAPAGDTGGGEGESRDLASMRPKDFLASKNPSTDVERVACLGYYLTHARDLAHFKTRDITDLNTEAAGHKLSNPSAAVKNAMYQNGYLAQAPKGARQITTLGEKVVSALPDRESVGAVLAAQPRRRKKPTRKKATRKTASRRS